jgi:hypothetical protein
MSDLVQLTYVSEACSGFEEHQIPELLRSIRPANARHHITGMLLYIQGTFLQILEGEAPEVDALYERIASDQRHRNVTLLIRQNVAERGFADWTMDYTTVDAQDAGTLAGDPELFKTAGVPYRPTAEQARKLISTFRRPSWQRTADSPNPRASSA